MKVLPKPEHGSLDWLAARHRDDEGRCTFGASDAPTLMGVSPYRSRADLWVDKRTAPTISEQTDVFMRGNLLEPVLLAEAGRRLGIDIETPPVMYRHGRFTVTLDGVDDVDAPQVIVEAKTTTRYRVRTADDLPSLWLYQGWAQQLVVEAPVMFVVLDADQVVSLVEMPTNGDAINALIAEAEAFGSAIDSGDDAEPALVDEMDAEHIAALWRPQPTSIELGDTAAEWLAMLDDARRAADDAKEQEKVAKDAIARLLLDHEVGTIGGQKVVSWKEQKGKVSLDAKALRADHPDLVSRYERVGDPFRVMRIHRPKQ
jgi:predicted phage-related endonuclease